MQKTHLRAIEQKKFSRFTFVKNTLSNSSNGSRANFYEGDGSLWFIGMCKCGSFKNPFAMITSLSKLYFRFRRFILLVKTKASDFYELWQHHKQLKTMEMSEA